MIVEGLDGKEEFEQEADVFAGDFLMNRRCYQEFVSKGNFSKNSVADFASELDTKTQTQCSLSGRQTEYEFFRIDSIRY